MTADEIIQRHLGGDIVDSDMLEKMANSLEPVAWMKHWRMDKREIWYSCCGGRMVQDKQHRLADEKQAAALILAKHRGEGVCPFCGREVRLINQKHVSKEDIAEEYHYFYRRSKAEPGTLLVLGVWCGKLWRRVKWDIEPEQITMQVEPCSMIVIPYGGKPERWVREALTARSARWYPNAGSIRWEKRSKVQGDCYQSWDGNVIKRVVHLEELDKALRGTPLGKTARWLAARGGACRDWVNVLSTAARYPQMEYMIARGLGYLAAAKVTHQNGAELINWRRKTLEGMTLLTRDEIGRMRAKGMELAPEELLPIHYGRRMGQKIKLEDAAEIMAKLKVESWTWLKKAVQQPAAGRYGVMRVLRYIARQRDKGQGRRWGMAQMWCDYMGELQALGSAQEEGEVFPKDLVEAHARTTARIRIKESQAEEAKLVKRLPELQKKYEFEAEGLILRPFESLAEVIAEGEVQSICIGSYAKRYAEGGCDLCKLRRADCPEKPFHAVEFTRGGAMVQCRGARNKTEKNDEEQVIRFWAAWDKARGTSTRPGLIIG